MVIPAHEGGADLLVCLESVAASTMQPEAVIVVDNASTDDSVDAVRRRFPDVEVVRNNSNRGFGAACNQGIERALARGDDYVFLLNQDATLEPETLGSLVELAAGQPRAGIVGVKTLAPRVAADGAPVLLYGGAWRSTLPLWQRIPNIGESSRKASSVPCRVDYVWGHAMLVRRQAIEDIGTFDPGFFMYCEDLDLCRRATEHGWEVWCDNRVVAWHAIEDASRAQGSTLSRWRWKQASARYFHRKHYRRWTAELLWTLTMVREALSLVRHRHLLATAHLVRAWFEVALR